MTQVLQVPLFLSRSQGPKTTLIQDFQLPHSQHLHVVPEVSFLRGHYLEEQKIYRVSQSGVLLSRHV